MRTLTWGLLGLLVGLSLLPGCSGGPEPSPPPSGPRPNIVLIMADDLGYGDLGCYGQQQISTPRIDAMAAQGMRFTQFYSGSTVCAPARCTLMTGLHTGHCRIRGNSRDPLLPEDVTMAEVLKGAGYTTAIFGKWGLGEAGSTGIPNRQGFDHWFGYLNQRHAHNYFPEFLWNNEQEYPLFNEVERKKEGDLGGVASQRIQYSHDLFTEQALYFVRENKEGPFFLYLPYTIPHANNEAGKEGMEVPELGEYENEDWPDAEKGKAAMITRLDRDVGRLLDELKALGIDDNTLVLFTSDNGPHKEGGSDPDFFDSSGAMRGIKRDLYEGGIRVPMIAVWPGTVAGGTESDAIWAHWDLLPTFADTAGTEAPDDLDGISFLPTILGKPQIPHEDLYWAFYEQGGAQALRAGNWKAVRKPADGPVQLFRLDQDPGETVDVAADHPDQVQRMTEAMDRNYQPSARWQFPHEKKPVTEG